jgi:hypothetical protein
MGEWKYLLDEKGEYLFNLVNDQGEKVISKHSNRIFLTI